MPNIGFKPMYLHTFQASRITDSMAEGNRQANGKG